MRVSLIDLETQHRALLPELRDAFERVTTSARFVGGEEVEALEEELAARCGATHVVGCGSGTDALILALLAADVGPGDEVIVPALSFYATAGAVALLGATPVFADVDAVRLGLDADGAGRAAGRCTRLRAILPVHLYGAPIPLAPLRALAKHHDAVLIEDAAQALGACHADGTPVGSGAEAGACFSFYPTKNLGAMGEAGCVSTDDDARASRLRRLRNHGSDERYRHSEVGWNARLDALQAAFLRVKLAHFERWSKARAENARDYDDRLRAVGARPADGVADGGWSEGPLPLLLPNTPAPPARHAFHHYVVRVPGDRREALRTFLAERGVDTAVYYPRGLHTEQSFAAPGLPPPLLPVVEQVCTEVLALPVHPSLRERDRERVADGIRDFFLR